MARINLLKQIEDHAEALGITVQELLRRAKIHRSQLSEWRAGNNEPSAKSANKCLAVGERKLRRIRAEQKAKAKKKVA